ncbi:TPA_asm: P [Mango betacytorhabdovirus 1]|nr:TPA_asm: P [Mango betacytorhabdovirus 1]
MNTERQKYIGEFSGESPKVDLSHLHGDLLDAFDELAGGEIPREQTDFDVQTAAKMHREIKEGKVPLEDSDRSYNPQEIRALTEPVLSPPVLEQKQTKPAENPFKVLPKTSGRVYVAKTTNLTPQDLPAAERTHFDPDLQRKMISQVFNKMGVRLDPMMESTIMSKGFAKRRVITENELEWYCEGVKGEQTVSMTTRLEQMLTHLGNEVSRLQSLSKNMADVEKKQREDMAIISKLRYAQTAGQQAGSDIIESTASSRTPHPSPQRDQIKGPRPEEIDEQMKYRSFLNKIGITKDIYMDKELEYIWPLIITKYDFELIPSQKPGGDYYINMCDYVIENIEEHYRLSQFGEKLTKPLDFGA